MVQTLLELKASRMYRRIIVIFFLFTGLWQELHACTCIGTSGVKKEIKNSDIVFVAKIVDKKELKIPYTLGSDTILYIHQNKYTAKISMIYKGKIKSQTVNIVTGIGGGDCGFIFEIGSDYIVYGDWRNEYYTDGERVARFVYTDICKRTKKYEEDEIAKIEKFKKGIKIRD